MHIEYSRKCLCQYEIDVKRRSEMLRPKKMYMNIIFNHSNNKFLLLSNIESMYIAFHKQPENVIVYITAASRSSSKERERENEPLKMKFFFFLHFFFISYTTHYNFSIQGPRIFHFMLFFPPIFTIHMFSSFILV